MSVLQSTKVLQEGIFAELISVVNRMNVKSLSMLLFYKSWQFYIFTLIKIFSGLKHENERCTSCVHRRGAFFFHVLPPHWTGKGLNVEKKKKQRTEFITCTELITIPLYRQQLSLVGKKSVSSTIYLRGRQLNLYRYCVKNKLANV